MEDKVRGLARSIVERFDDLLDDHGIRVPDPDRTGDETEAAIYGCTYGNLVDEVEAMIRESGVHHASQWWYRSGKLVCKECGFHPTFSLRNDGKYSNGNFCPNCGSDMKAKEVAHG